VKTIDCLGYSVYSENILPSSMSKEKIVVNTINPHCYCEAKKDSIYKKALTNSDILLPDGIGIVWAIKTLRHQKIKRFSGSDLHLSLLKQLNKAGGKVFYMGSSDSTLQMIYEKIKKEYPNISVGSYPPPYKPVFTVEENIQIIDSINEFNPDILFVGMTAPKQEKWVYEHKDHINANVIASVGAVFDFYAGTIKRPGTFWINLGLEWLPRLLREPKRLWHRNLISTPKFIWDVFVAKMNNR